MEKTEEKQAETSESILDLGDIAILGELPYVELTTSFKGEPNVPDNVVHQGQYTLSIIDVHEYITNHFDPVYTTKARVRFSNGNVTVENIAYSLHNDKANMIDSASSKTNYRDSIEKKLKRDLCEKHGLWVQEERLGLLVEKALEPYQERAKKLSEIHSDISFDK